MPLTHNTALLTDLVRLESAVTALATARR